MAAAKPKHYTEILEFNEKLAPEDFKIEVKKLLGKIDNEKTLGEKLLREIANNSKVPFKFRKSPGHFNWHHKDEEFYLDLDLFKNTLYELLEPTQAVVVRRDMIYIYLFHELVHYYHYAFAKKSYTVGIYEEIRTTGLYMHMNEEYSENAFRKALNFPYRRPCYSFHDKVKKGNPVLPGEPYYYALEKQIRATQDLPEQNRITTLQSEECKHGFDWNNHAALPRGDYRRAGPIRHIPAHPARSHRGQRP